MAEELVTSASSIVAGSMKPHSTVPLGATRQSTACDSLTESKRTRSEVAISDKATLALLNGALDNHSDWDRVAQRLVPKLGRWLLASITASLIMLFVSPLHTSRPVLVSASVLILTPAVFLLGWMAGMSTFAISCQTWRRIGWHVRLVNLLPFLLCAVAALGLLGGGSWWIFSVVVAFLGHRKGSKRAWWGAVCCVAFVLRTGICDLPGLAESNEDALSQAMESINREIRTPTERLSLSGGTAELTIPDKLQGETPMQHLQIDELLHGVETGNFTPNVGSQFGSLWGWDGLMAQEASPEEYSACGAGSSVKLCHGWPVNWLGERWSAILMYQRENLAQINIHTEPSDATFNTVCAKLEIILGNKEQIKLPQDMSLSVLCRFVWNCRGGSVFLLRTPTFTQVGIAPVGGSPTSSGCLGLVVIIAIGLSLAAWFT